MPEFVGRVFTPSTKHVILPMSVLRTSIFTKAESKAEGVQATRQRYAS